MGPSERRSYAQYCGTARALDVLGERWTLLIVRDLLPGPRRYGELASRLPGIATDILTNRLRSLEEHGLVVREEQAGVGGPVSYRLTESGAALRPVIETLADIGARWLESPTTTTARLDLGWALGAAAARLRPSEVPSTPMVVSSGDQRFVLEATEDRILLRYLDEPVAEAVVCTGTTDQLLAVLSGHLDLRDTDVTIDGDAEAASSWIEAVISAVPDAARGRGRTPSG